MAEIDNEQLKVNINGGIFPIWWLRKKNGITTDLLSDKVVTTAKLADGAVTEDKLAAAVKDLIDGKAGTTYVNTELAKKMNSADFKVLQFNGFVDNVTIENSSVGTVTVSDIKYDKTRKYFVALKEGKYYNSWSTPASSDYNVYSSGWKTANNAFINIGTGDMEAPKMAQFGGYVDNVTIETYSGPIPIPGVAKDIFWDTTHQKFVIKVVSGTAPLTSTHYYDNWATKSLYHNADGSLTNNVYVDVSTVSLASEIGDIASDVTQIKGQLTQLPTVVAQAQGAVASEEQLKAKVESLCGFSAIDDFDAETDYLINDICTKEGKVWRCINTHTGAWDASHFVETSLAELVQTMCAGAMENVKIEMSCEDEVSWDDYNVIVENVSAGETNTYAVDEDGVVEFTIPKGDVYSVSFPAIDTYIQPADRQFIAQNGDRVIRVTYSQAPEKNETINIHATVHSFDEGTSALLDGSVFYAKNDSGTVIATTTMSSGLAVLTIPYGTHYTLHMADLDGYTHNHRSDVHTAGVVSRDVLVTYSAIGYGVYGLDSEGNVYTTEQVAELENKDIIIAVAYNDSYLNSADRGDGTTGCGFCWLVTSPTMNKQWATSNVEFDKTRLPFVTKDADGLLVCQGEKNTELIMEIGSELGVGTPAATWCNESVLTIGGVDKNGFLPAYGQLRRLALNQSLIDEFYTALGKTEINILSGYWWTSCQFSASTAVTLDGGSFNGNTKTSNGIALRVFDL